MPQRSSAGRRAFYDRITQEHAARAAQWQRDREAFVAEHGQAAWDAKTEREINYEWANSPNCIWFTEPSVQATESP